MNKKNHPADFRYLKTAIKAADDKKAKDIVILGIGSISLIADYLVVCTANNPIHARAITDAVEESLIKEGFTDLRIEGKRESTWILMDMGSIIIHVMTERLRNLYHLERFWAGGQSIPLQDILSNS